MRLKARNLTCLNVCVYLSAALAVSNVYVPILETQALHPRAGCDVFYSPTFTVSPAELSALMTVASCSLQWIPEYLRAGSFLSKLRRRLNMASLLLQLQTTHIS